MDKMVDEMYMRRCLQLARNGLQGAKPNPMVGACIVADGRIIGEGYHAHCGQGHAEVNAFASVRAEDEHLLSRATIYVSLEPCSHYGKTPPCADLIIKKGVKRCVCGCIDPFAKVQGRGVKKIREAGIEVTVGVLERECLELNRRFITVNQLHRPYIMLKWAQTANGFIDNGGKALAISTPFTKMLSHKLRAESDAILVGRITDEREHPSLTTRYWSGKSPERLVLSHSNGITAIIDHLMSEGAQSLIVEGGLQTLNSFIAADLWDEIRIETSPMVVDGGTKAPELPENTYLVKEQSFDGNTIKTYFKKK
jgi:diaminohydroxyphosphoribosylaminopyrimidine deaminase/5-amino-6-(5-phosphoribosylamino)uracil reductase